MVRSLVECHFKALNEFNLNVKTTRQLFSPFGDCGLHSSIVNASSVVGWIFGIDSKNIILVLNILPACFINLLSWNRKTTLLSLMYNDFSHLCIYS